MNIKRYYHVVAIQNTHGLPITSIVIAVLKPLVPKELGSSIFSVGVGKIISDRMLMEILDDLMF